MSLEDLLKELRALEVTLRSAEVQNFFKGRPESERKEFVGKRRQVSAVVEKLTNIQLAAIADKLDQLADDLQSGISDLKTELKKLESTIAILNKIGSVLGTVAKVAGALV